jgi:hypothetical protein
MMSVDSLNPPNNSSCSAAPVFSWLGSNNGYSSAVPIFHGSVLFGFFCRNVRFIVVLNGSSWFCRLMLCLFQIFKHEMKIADKYIKQLILE